MAKRKGGLHKKVSSIFDGVPIPQDSALRPVHSSDDEGSESAQHRSTPSSSHANQPRMYSGETLGGRVSGDDRGGGFTGRFKKKLFTPSAGVSAVRQKFMVILMLVLAVVFVVKIYPLFKSSPTQKGPSKPQTTKSQVRIAQGASVVKDAVSTKDTGVVEIAEINWQRPEVYPAQLRDVMYVKEDNVIKPGESKADIFIVESILAGQTKRSAVIGIRRGGNPENVEQSRILKEGESAFGATVVTISIENDSVELEKVDGERWWVKCLSSQE